MVEAESESAIFSEGVAELSNILVLAPALDPHEDEACMDLSTISPSSETAMLSITFTQSPDERIERWRTHNGNEQPASMNIISVGEKTRSTASFNPGLESNVHPISIAAISDPRDLTQLGIEITEALSEWQDRSLQIVVCFHSLTTLLQYADLQRVFRFLHVLTGRMENVDAVAHYHLNPGAHDQQTINTLTTLFDAVVELTDDDQWQVRQRGGHG